MGPRNTAVFYRIASFDNGLNTFDTRVVATIEAHIVHFERAWKASGHDGEIPSSFFFEAYLHVDEPYRLCQIRVGPKRGYRALIMFLNRSPNAFWIYVFKKVKNRQPEDMERARIIAQKLWNQLQER